MNQADRTQHLEMINDFGEYDNREWDGRRWNGHAGKADSDSHSIYLSRFWGDYANHQKIVIEKEGKGVRIWVTPEIDSGTWVKGKKFKINFERLVSWLAGEKEAIEQSPQVVWERIQEEFLG